jgi:hypothetical protein
MYLEVISEMPEAEVKKLMNAIIYPNRYNRESTVEEIFSYIKKIYNEDKTKRFFIDYKVIKYIYSNMLEEMEELRIYYRYENNQLIIENVFKFGQNDITQSLVYEKGKKVNEYWKSEKPVKYFELTTIAIKVHWGMNSLPSENELIEIEEFIKAYKENKNRIYEIEDVHLYSAMEIRLKINHHSEFKFFVQIKEKEIKSITMQPFSGEFKYFLDHEEIKNFILTHPKLRLDFILK